MVFGNHWVNHTQMWHAAIEAVLDDLQLVGVNEDTCAAIHQARHQSKHARPNLNLSNLTSHLIVFIPRFEAAVGSADGREHYMNNRRIRLDLIKADMDKLLLVGTALDVALQKALTERQAVRHTENELQADILENVNAGDC